MFFIPGFLENCSVVAVSGRGVGAAGVGAHVVGMTVLFAISIELPGSGRVWSRRQAVESILRVSNRVFHRHGRGDSFPGPGNRITISSFLLISVSRAATATEVEVSTSALWKCLGSLFEDRSHYIGLNLLVFFFFYFVPDIPYILKSNPHPFYSYRGLKNQMRIRIAC